MAYCGAKRVADGSVCSDSSMSTVLPNGRGGPSQAQQEPAPDTVTGAVAWNSDTTPVQAGRRPAEYSDYIPGGRRQTTEANMSTVAEQRETFNAIRGKGTVKGADKAAKQEWNGLLGAMRRYTGSELGTRGSQEQAWADILKDASRAGVDVYDLLNGRPTGGGDGSGRGGSGSGSSGPRTTSSASITDATTAEALLNKVATDLIGRNLTANEIKKYTQQFNTMERQNPAMTTTSESGSVSTSAPDKAELLRQVVSKNPDYMKYQVDTTVMDMFLDRIKEGQAVANG